MMMGNWGHGNAPAVCRHSRLVMSVLMWLALFSVALGADDELRLTKGTVLRFAKAREAADLLGRRDRYFELQSPLDRQLRRQTDQPVSLDQFALYSSTQALAWLSGERTEIGDAAASLSRHIEGMTLPWPEVITLVHTTGREESDSAYCRGATIAMSSPRLQAARSPDKLEHLLAHELFHVLSSHNLELRKSLYAIIGFTLCNEITLPPVLAERKITNPDAPTIDCTIDVPSGDRTLHLAPVLLSKYERYDPQKGKQLFDYISFQLLEVEQKEGRWQVVETDGHPVLHDPRSLPDFAKQIGSNTGYIIHPDEILAENFAMLVTGRKDVPTPRILQEMDKLLRP